MGQPIRYSLGYSEVGELNEKNYIEIPRLRMKCSKLLLDCAYHFRSCDDFREKSYSSFEWYGEGGIKYKTLIKNNPNQIVLEEERIFSLRLTSLLCWLPFDKSKIISSFGSNPGA